MSAVEPRRSSRVEAEAGLRRAMGLGFLVMSKTRPGLLMCRVASLHRHGKRVIHSAFAIVLPPHLFHHISMQDHEALDH